MDPKVKEILEQGTSFENRLKNRWWRIPLAYFKGQKYLPFRIAVAVALLVLGAWIQTKPFKIHQEGHGRVVLERLIPKLNEELASRSRNQSFSGWKLRQYETNVSEWQPLKEILEKWFFHVGELLGNSDPEGVDVRFNYEARLKKVSFSYHLSKEPLVWHEIEDLESNSHGIWGPLVGGVSLLLTGAWLPSIGLALVSGVVIEQGGDLVLAFQQLGHLLMASLTHIFFWGVLFFSLIAVFFQYEKLNLQKSMFNSWGFKLSIPSGILGAFIFPWGEVFRSRFLVYQKLPRNGFGVIVLITGALAGTLVCFPMGWQMNYSSALKMAQERSLVGLLLGGWIFLFVMLPVLSARDRERLEGWKQDPLEKSPLLTSSALWRRVVEICASVLVLDGYLWWSHNLRHFDYLLVALSDLGKMGGSPSVSAFLAGGVMSFITGYSSQVIDWFGISGSLSSGGIYSESRSMGALIDGALIGGILSPFGVPFFFYHIGCLRPYFEIWSRALIWLLPFLAVNCVLQIFKFEWLTPVWMGVFAGILLSFLSYALMKIRDSALKKELENWRNKQRF